MIRANEKTAEGLQSSVGAFQSHVDAWMDACFGAEIKADVLERCDRFLEEALEFVQAAGYSPERANALVGYTFGRPVGEINQEVGGVMVTLAAMCNTIGVDIGAAAEGELERVWTKIDKIRAKQAAKPTGSALPQ
jgi:NTP pyrophosphatase (non-canonical NTP hydrolase)